MSSPSGRKATSLQADPGSPVARRRGCLRAQGWAGRDHGEPQVCTQAGSGRARAAPQAQASGWEGGREREEGGEPGRCHCRGRGGAGDPAEGLQQCLVGAGAAMSLILGSGACVPGRALHLSAAPRYHPEFSKGGGKGGGGSCRVVPGAGREPAELGEGKQGPRPLPSPRERAPAAPAVAGTFPLSQSLSPTGLPRSTGELLSTTPVCTLAAWAAHPALTWERCPPPLKI